MSDNNKTNDELLTTFLTEGLSTIREVQKENERISKKILNLEAKQASTDDKISSSDTYSDKAQERIEQKIATLKSNVKENTEKVSQRSKDIETKVNNVEKDIAVLKSGPEGDNIKKIEDEITELEKRLGKIESRQMKWSGAIAVIGVVIGFLFSMFTEWGGSFIGME